MKWWWGTLCGRPTHLAGFADRHAAPLGHIFVIPSQQVFALSP